MPAPARKRRSGDACAGFKQLSQALTSIMNTPQARESSMQQPPAPTDLRRRSLLRAGLAGSSLLLLPGCGRLPGNIAAKETALPATAGMPHGLHVSFTGDPHSSRTVTWFTDGLDAGKAVLQYGPVAPGMTAEQIQSQPLPATVEAVSSPAHGIEVLTHRATAAGLDAGLPLRYRVGNGERWSPVHVLAPAATGKFRFAHFGDHGMSDYSRATVQRVLERNPDFFLLAGDLSYANGRQELWNPYFDLLEPLTARIPMMAAAGNHEDEDNGGLAYKSRTSHPGQGTYYSFEYNRVHFQITTAGCLISDGTLAQELVQMELDLAQAAARRAAGLIDYIIVVQHFTTWTDEDGRSPANPTLVALEEHILLRYGVDLLLNGHDHEYQRSVPFAYGIPNPLGYVQVINGVGGVGVREFSGQQSWSAAQKLRYGFTEYEVDGPRIRATAWAIGEKDGPILETPEIMDQFEVPARGLLARREAVRPVRAPETLLADFDGVARHTLERNRRHLRGGHLHA